MGAVSVARAGCGKGEPVLADVGDELGGTLVGEVQVLEEAASREGADEWGVGRVLVMWKE